jgi:ferric-dicitrate binding protein FerR (iron transport regulator)
MLVLLLQLLISSGLDLDRPTRTAQPLAGTVWRTGATPRRILLGRHRLDLAVESQARLASGTDSSTIRVIVDQGSATFIVAPLDSGRTFQVETPHARVEVKGTRFSVTVQRRCTRVAVSTGVVLVAARGRERVQVGRLVSGGSRVLCAGQAPAPRSRTAREQEQELQQALRLLLAGQELERVEQILSGYLQEHPGGVFVEDALFHLIFVKSRLGRSEKAKKLAESFLAQFPESERAQRVGGWLKKRAGDDL